MFAGHLLKKRLSAPIELNIGTANRYWPDKERNIGPISARYWPNIECLLGTSLKKNVVSTSLKNVCPN